MIRAVTVGIAVAAPSGPVSPGPASPGLVSPGLVSPGPASFAPVPGPSGLLTTGDAPTWADQLEAWSTLAGAIVALAAAVATILLLVHQIGETRRARADARSEREQAERDRNQAAVERFEVERVQARTILLDGVRITGGHADDGGRVDRVCARVTNYGIGPVLDVTVYYRVVDRAGNAWRYLVGRTTVLGPAGTLPVDLAVGVAAGDDADSYLIVFFTDMAGRAWARRPGEQPLTEPAIDAYRSGRIVDMLAG